MLYRSTRGGVSGRSFAEVLIDGLAPDGGLYVPESLPPLPPPATDYAGAVAAFSRLFIAPDDMADELEGICARLYSQFRHPEVAPIRAVGGDRHLLELFWGPTLSFKDYALQLVGALFDLVLARRGDRLLVLGATSGDTGSAAIEACRGRPNIDIVILFPDQGLSEVQRKQMTTIPDGNVHPVAVAGTFDDCQRLVKAAFTSLGDRHPLGSINSINWARVMAQGAYYWFATSHFDRPIDVVVPTGNFGNVLSAHLARRMGAAIDGVTIANNANRGVYELVETARLSVGTVTPTVAPAMDIQIPSNLERYLFEVLDDDPGRLRHLQDGWDRTGAIELPPEVAKRLQDDFGAGWRTDDEIRETIRAVYQRTGVVLDPHTAIAWSVADEAGSPNPTVVVATAHPAKFGDVVAEAVGTAPQLPEEVAVALRGPERTERISPDFDELAALLDAI